MPVVKSGSGYKIRRSAGGLYPKIYASRAEAEKRVVQMEVHKAMNAKKGKYPIPDRLT